MCLWALNPAVAFAAVAAQARSIILTSGTLSPLESFASEVLAKTNELLLALSHETCEDMLRLPASQTAQLSAAWLYFPQNMAELLFAAACS